MTQPQPRLLVFAGRRRRAGGSLAISLVGVLVGIFAWAWPAPARAQELAGIDLARLIEQVSPAGLVVSLIVIAIALLVLRFITGLTDSLSKRFSDRRLMLQQISTVLRFIIYVLTSILVVSASIRLEGQVLVALAVAIGFALKDLASSVLAGIIILFDRPFQVGDRVTVAGHYGEILAIGLRSVRLVTLDDSLVTIPNNRFLTEAVVSGNAGALDMQIVMDFYVAIDSDLRTAKRIVYEAVRTSRFVYLEKPVVVLVTDIIESSYFATRLRAKAYVLDVRYEKLFASDVTERVKMAYLDQGIRPPSVLHRGTDASRQAPAHPPAPVASSSPE
ncbi:mechanosensitive ion channel family protein [Haliangium sp.]|uniref:mechanosensitive ion channel family protein n=1 Tax=Haliangium sp. TaxID=2663208 RepID=UPI003D0D1A38